MLDVRDVTVALRRARRCSTACRSHVDARRGRRPARAVGQRQEHAAARDRRAAGARRRHGAARRPRRHRAADAPARHRHGVPGRAAVPASRRRRQRRRSGCGCSGVPRAPIEPRGSPSCSTSSASPASAAARRHRPQRRRGQARSRSPARSPRRRGCCCSTSRSPASTASCTTGSPATSAGILRAAGTTALLVTHDRDEAAADRRPRGAPRPTLGDDSAHGRS